MAVNIQGDNSAASPGLTGGDTDTGVRMGTNELSLVTDGTNRVNVDSSGNTTVASGTLTVTAGDLTLSDGNLVVASGHGIDFSATANSSGTMTSELLDDYEEGTWTPRLNGWNGTSSSYVNVTNTSSRAGTYTKVGNKVTLFIEYVWSSMNIDNTRPWYIYDLPFTKVNGGCSGGSLGRFEGVGNPEEMCLWTEGTTTQLYIMNHPSGSGPNNSSGNSGRLLCTINYETTQ